MLLSIIIPMYNSEEFLNECLDSIVYQLLPNTELIIVNDCSTDNSKSILNHYLQNIVPEKSALIKVIDLEENKGVGFSRMIAIANSCGKYICSIDPDDIISNNYILKIITILETCSPDILQFHIARFIEKIDSKYTMSVHFLDEGAHIMDRKIKIKFYEQNFWSFCSNVIRKDLFDGIDFSNLRNCEDVYALPLILSKVKKIYILNEDMYLYRLNFNSLSKSDKNIINCINAYRFIIGKYIDLMKQDADLYYALIPIIRNYIKFCFNNIGYKVAKLTLNDIKKEVKFLTIFDKMSHNFFVVFGVNFLFILRLIGK